MNVYYGFDGLADFENLTATMGSFDGVHHGHRLLIEYMNQQVRKSESGRGSSGREQSCVITFEPHPRVVLHPDRGQRLLSTLPEKLMLLSETGVDNVVVIPFTWEFSRVTSQQFIEHYIIGKLRVRTMITGQSHFFGRDKGGDISLLREYGVEVQDLERFDNISSTMLRDVIGRGDMNIAAELLGGGYLVKLPVAELQHKLMPEYSTRCDIEVLEVYSGGVVAYSDSVSPCYRRVSVIRDTVLGDALSFLNREITTGTLSSCDTYIKIYGPGQLL